MKTKVAVFFGGRSTEHEISVISALQTINNIDKDKYDVVPVYITKDGKWLTGDELLDAAKYRTPALLLKSCKEVCMHAIYGDNNLYYVRPEGFLRKREIASHIDVVFPVLHGMNGEDGVFQGVVETIGLPYVGCDVLSSANGMDKIFMKMILEAEGIPVVPFVWFTDKSWYNNSETLEKEIAGKLAYPVIVKPSNLGSSVGIGKASDARELSKRVSDAIKYSSRIIVEKMITDMQEINCSVLGDCDDCKPSVLEEPIKTGSLLSYEDKYMGGTKTNEGMEASSKRIPAELDENVTVKIQQMAVDTFKVLGCNGVSRVDVMIDRIDGNIYVNEINTIPGSLSYYLWEYTGLSFKELLDKLISLALKRRRERDKKITSYSLNIFNIKGAGTKGAKGGTKALK